MFKDISKSKRVPIEGGQEPMVGSLGTSADGVFARGVCHIQRDPPISAGHR
jgi:hypothetical protein